MVDKDPSIRTDCGKEQSSLVIKQQEELTMKKLQEEDDNHSRVMRGKNTGRKQVISRKDTKDKQNGTIKTQE